MAIQKDHDLVAAEILALENRAMNTLGTGFNTFGYGQIFNPVSVQGQDVSIEHLNNLRDMLNTARAHQTGNEDGFGSTLVKPNSLTDVDSALVQTYQDALDTIEVERLQYGMASMTVTGRLLTLTRNTRWGPRITLTGDVEVTWPTADEARWFFNSGGEIRLNLGHSNTSTVADRSWNRSLGRIGTIRFQGHSTKGDSNQVGIPNASVGFYTLVGRQMIYDGTDIDDSFDHLDRTPNKYQFKDSAYIYAEPITNGIRISVELLEKNNQINNLGTYVGFSSMYATSYLRNRVITLPNFVITKTL